MNQEIRSSIEINSHSITEEESIKLSKTLEADQDDWDEFGIFTEVQHKTQNK